MSPNNKRLLITFAVTGTLLLLSYADNWVRVLIGVSVISIALFLLIVNWATTDPNELEAKRYGWESWSPHDPSVHGAEMAIYDHERNFGGNLNSVGSHVDVNGTDRILWFPDKHTALCFFRDDYYYLTDDYAAEEVPYNDKFDEEVLAKFDKLMESNEPSVTIMSNFLTKLFPDSFKYIGTLSHICASKKGMSNLRSEFRNANSRGESNGPLSNSDIDGFIGFLDNYDVDEY